MRPAGAGNRSMFGYTKRPTRFENPIDLIKQRLGPGRAFIRCGLIIVLVVNEQTHEGDIH